MTPLQPLRVGMIGVGNYGAARRTMMRETGLFDLVAAYDLNEQALSACVEQDGAQAVGGYDELLSVPGLEAVVISTGAKFHAEQIVKACERGLHVFVEKPLCSTPEELRAVMKAMAESGVVIGVGHADHSQSPVSRAIMEQIASGALGKVASVEKTTCHSGGWFIKPGDWRGDPKKNPGGMLFQCGVHAFHELMHYFGPVKSVSCMMRWDVNNNTGTADVAICHLHFESGLIGTLNAYHVCPYRHTLSVFGTKANLYRFDYYFDEGTELYRQAEHLDGKKQPRERIEFNGNGDRTTGLRSFYTAVREGTPCSPSLEDGARAVAMVFAAEESARTGRVVDVAPYMTAINT